MITPIKEIIAERAALAPDAENVMAAILEEYGTRRSQRRTTFAVAGTALAVAVVSAVAVAAPWRHESRQQRPGAGHAVSSTSSEASRSSVSSSSPRTRSSTSQTAPRRPLRLVAAPAAPPSAAISLGRVPAGWAYLTAQGAITAYAPAGTPRELDLTSQLAVYLMAGLDGSYPLRIGGRPGRVSESDGMLLAFVDYGTYELRVQVPASTGISRSQMIELAGSATVRSGAPKGQ